MTIEAAAALLQGQGLCVGVEQDVGPQRGPIVADQAPQPGSVVPPGTLVNLGNTSVENISGILSVIGERNRDMGCNEGIGVGGEPGGAA